jgi:hypothetical protein
MNLEKAGDRVEMQRPTGNALRKAHAAVVFFQTKTKLYSDVELAIT